MSRMVDGTDMGEVMAATRRTIVLDWLSKPDIAERIHRLEGLLRSDGSYPIGLLAALRQLAEQQEEKR